MPVLEDADEDHLEVVSCSALGGLSSHSLPVLTGAVLVSIKHSVWEVGGVVLD